MRLGGAHGLLEPVDRPGERDLLQRRAGVGPHRGAAGVGPHAVDRGPDDDLQQPLAVEVGGERLADAAHRVLQARALLVELLQALLQLARHLVELLAQRRELVVALGRDLDGEVARAQAPGGLQEGVDLALQRARDQQREGEGEDEEAGQDAGRQQAAVAHGRGLHRLGREHGDPIGLAEEAGRLERGGVEALVADLELAVVGGDRGRVDALDRRRQHRTADALHDRP